MQATANFVLRDAQPGDHTAARVVLVDAFHDGAVTTWAEPDPVARAAQLRTYFTALLKHTAAHGTIRLVESTGTVIGVALWYPYPGRGAGSALHDLLPDDMAGSPSARRVGQLEKLLQDRRPRTRHDYLAYLGVARGEQNRGAGTVLVTEHLAQLRDAGVPAYLEANDARNAQLYARLGFVPVGESVTGHGGPPVQPMWWVPDLDDVRLQ